MKRFGAGESLTYSCKLIRGHSKEVYHLEWFKDQQFIISGSHDFSIILWEVKKGRIFQRFDGPTNYVKAVGVDPTFKYLVAQSCDRTLRIFKRNKQKKPSYYIKYSVNKVNFPGQIDEANIPIEQKLFLHESSIESFFRRLDWSPEGSIFIAPGGEYYHTTEYKKIYCAYVFSKHNLSLPCLVIPCTKPVILIKFCPLEFVLSEDETSLFKIDSKLVYAIASNDTVFIYTTCSVEPLYMVSGIHYASLSDLAWYGKEYLVISSTDGYISFIKFKENDFGEVKQNLEQIHVTVDNTDKMIIEKETKEKPSKQKMYFRNGQKIIKPKRFG